ncbi:MAG: protoheme IX farnesyltransferase [Chthoniobacterales bacterium]|nr:protoheme IX farnesyltransferase [Chthoniobacterales bacterium]
MKTTAQTMPRTASAAADFAELVKARLSLLALSTAMAGFALGTDGPWSYLLLAATLAGTALSAGGAAALNQWWERGPDALMRRTRGRPLPAGRMTAPDALLVGLAFSVCGVAVLALFANVLSASLAAATIVFYILVYTPLKRVTSLNTIIGAVPGALPPLIGWAAARGSVNAEALTLFAVLFLWQMPHFLAIAWLYRDDYARGGFKMLPEDDADGTVTGRQSVVYSLALLAVSLLPSVFFGYSAVYFYGALCLGAGFSLLAVRFACSGGSAGAAKALFLGSIAYLPLLLGLMVLAR